MRWKNRPQGSTWGDWGADDQLGRVNLLDAAGVRRGAAEVREGIRFCLSLPLDRPGGSGLSARRPPPRLRPTCRDGVPYLNFPLAWQEPSASDVISDDEATLSLQFSTQWDALAHVGALFDADGDGRAEPVYYNGFRAGIEIEGPVDFHAPQALRELDARDRAGLRHRCGAAGHGAGSRAKALGIETLAATGMQGRGVLVDLRAHHGDRPAAIGYDAWMRVLEADGIEVERGDMLLVRTGFADWLLAQGDDLDRARADGIGAVLDGQDDRLLQWISDSGIAALAADNPAVERYVPPAARAGDGPAPERRPLLPLHHHCLFKLGLPLGELWHLGPLADWLRAHGRQRFLLTAPPLRLPGAMGSPVTPVATV